MKQLIVITTPTFYPDESSLLERLFDEGMRRLHLRKPQCDRSSLEALLDKIPLAYYPRIVLHDWFDLAVERNLGGIHLNGRNPEPPSGYAGRVSRSCHSLEEVDQHKSRCDYVFLSPIFQSISKEGYGNGFTIDELRVAGIRGRIDDKVIALGGISGSSLSQIKDIPFGGFAVIGALWGNDPSLKQADHIVQHYKDLQLWL